ncbi:hypothetical protein D3C73_1281330 [compost metagenome]
MLFPAAGVAPQVVEDVLENNLALNPIEFLSVGFIVDRPIEAKGLAAQRMAIAGQQFGQLPLVGQFRPFCPRADNRLLGSAKCGDLFLRKTIVEGEPDKGPSLFKGALGAGGLLVLCHRDPDKGGRAPRCLLFTSCRRFSGSADSIAIHGSPDYGHR